MKNVKYLVIQVGGTIGDHVNLRRYHNESVYTSFNTEDEAYTFVKHVKERLPIDDKTTFQVVKVKPYEK